MLPCFCSLRILSHWRDLKNPRNELKIEGCGSSPHEADLKLPPIKARDKRPPSVSVSTLLLLRSSFGRTSCQSRRGLVNSIDWGYRVNSTRSVACPRRKWISTPASTCSHSALSQRSLSSLSSLDDWQGRPREFLLFFFSLFSRVVVCFHLGLSRNKGQQVSTLQDPASKQ